jgi:hypothetical protein
MRSARDKDARVGCERLDILIELCELGLEARELPHFVLHVLRTAAGDACIACKPGSGDASGVLVRRLWSTVRSPALARHGDAVQDLQSGCPGDSRRKAET